MRTRAGRVVRAPGHLHVERVAARVRVAQGPGAARGIGREHRGRPRSSRRTCPAPAWCRAQLPGPAAGPRPCPPWRPPAVAAAAPKDPEGTRAAAWPPLILARWAAGSAGWAGRQGQAWTCQGPAAQRDWGWLGAGALGGGGAEVASGHCGGSGSLWSSSLAPTHGLKQQLEEKEQRAGLSPLGRVH